MTNGKIVDTSIWINYFNSVKDENSELLNQLIDSNQVILLPIIVQEILQGIKSDKIFEVIKELLLSFHFMEHEPVHASIEAASLYRFLRQKGVTIRKPNDCLIAAICINNRVSLFHNDKDFDHIAKHTNLKIYKNKE